MSNGRTHHMQTPEGKRHSAEARRHASAQRPATSAPEVFVVRLASSKPYGWQIRKFGSFVLSRSAAGYATELQARTAGENALNEPAS